MKHTVAIIGAGLIGRAWAIVFARAGFSVALHDVSEEALKAASASIETALDGLIAAGLITETEGIMRNIRMESELGDALAKVDYVQECGPERVEAKRELFGRLDELADRDTILASSTSGIVASRFVDDLEYPQRCLVAHPVNPPYLIPLVEIAPAPQTSNDTVARAEQLLREAGQVPVIVRKEVQGFILNRLQGAVLNEALRLVEHGYVSVEDLDRTVKHGLGLRWSFMGPFETIDLNAPGGIADYARRYGPLYQEMAVSQAESPDWSEKAINRLESERRRQLPEDGLDARQQWRDKRLMALAAHHISLQQTMGS